MGEFYTPELEGGLRFCDPRLGIDWPLPPSEVSSKDRAWPLLDEYETRLRREMQD
jgi:dTDP-4-dehydrorhamnose 3,5-epimerase